MSNSNVFCADLYYTPPNRKGQRGSGRKLIGGSKKNWRLDPSFSDFTPLSTTDSRSPSKYTRPSTVGTPSPLKYTPDNPFDFYRYLSGEPSYGTGFTPQKGDQYGTNY